MKNLILLSISILISSCSFVGICTKGNGSISKITKDYSNFNEISVNGSVNVIITRSDNFNVEVETDENLLDLVKVELEENDELMISTENVCPTQFNVYVSMPELTEVEVSGSGDVISESVFETEEFEIDIAGSGNVQLNINSTNAEIEIAGSGDVIISGRTGELDIDIAGSGSVNADGFESAKASIEIAGSGDASVNVSNLLDVQIAGSGDVIYQGNPKISTDVSGSGSVKRK